MTENPASQSPKTSRRTIRLRTTLVVPFVLQVVAAVGLVGWLSFRSGQQSVSEMANQLQREIASRVYTEADRYLEQPLLLHQVNVELLQRNLIDPQNPEALVQYFWSQGQSFNRLGTLAFANDQGEFFGANGLENYVVIASEANGRVLRRYAVDDQGNRGEVLQERENYDARDRSWYQTAVEIGYPTWTEIEPSAIGQRLDASLVYPVYRSDQSFEGVLLCDVSLAGINEFLEGLQIGKTGEAFIIDRDGFLVASSIPNSVTRVNSQEQLERVKATDSPEPLIYETVHALEQHFITLTNIQETQNLQITIDHQTLFLQVLPFKDDNGLDWLIAIVVPERDFLDRIQENTRYTIFLTGLALAIAIGVGMYTTRWISHPIEQVIDASEQVALGDLDQSLPPSDIVELNTLATAFNNMAGQLKMAFDTLEDKVKARTAELEEANHQINALNTQLKADNIRMGAELAVVRQLQQMILPKEDELAQISDLEIAGFMEAADEVGGDYYDVIQTGDRITVGIGDVTGHGLESGVLMIMVQASVRMLLALNEQAPIKSLNALNQVIYQNIQRMGKQRNLTLSLLSYAHGNLSITGQHEELIVIRANGTTERVDTINLGFPLGMVEDISEFVAQSHITLNIGDGVVLYTDGITEAVNAQQEFYGLPRLVQTLQTHWQKSVYDIRTAVVKDVRSHIGTHTVYDDITLVVMKRHA